MSSIAVLIGNPQAGSRTRSVAEELAGQLAAATGAAVEESIELADVADELFDWGSERVSALVERLRSATVLIVATPTYKASYTGLLKAFLDRYDADALLGVIAVPLFTIGGPQHALAVEYTLRPLLVEIGASVPTRGLAFPAAQTEERERIIGEWLETYGAPLRAALTA